MLELLVGSVHRLTGSLGEAAQQTRIGTEIQRKKISWSPRGRHSTLLTGGKRNKGKNQGSQLCVYKVNTFLDRYRYMLEISLLEIYFKEKWISFHKPYLPIEQEWIDSLETILFH